MYYVERERRRGGGKEEERRGEGKEEEERSGEGEEEAGARRRLEVNAEVEGQEGYATRERRRDGGGVVLHTFATEHGVS